MTAGVIPTPSSADGLQATEARGSPVPCRGNYRLTSICRAQRVLSAIMQWMKRIANPIGSTFIRKPAETNLMKREALLQKTFDVLPIGLWFTDKNGKLLRGNPAGIKIWGKEMLVATDGYGVFKARRLPSGEELAPSDWALMHTIRDKATILDELLEIESFDGHKKIILNSTAPVLDDNGSLQGAIVVNQDVTERQLAEERLHEQMQELERWHDATLGREDRIIELKREVNALLEKAGHPPRYTLDDDPTPL